MRENAYQRRLPQHGALAAHVWARDDQQTICRVVEIDAVGNEWRVDEDFDHRMSPINNFDLIAIVHRWSNVSTAHRRFGQRGERVEARHSPRGGLNSRSFGRDLTANEREDFRFKLQDPFFGAPDLALPFFQSRRRESLRIRQSLPSFVVRWHACSVRF